MISCVLCRANAEEDALYEDARIKIVSTLNMKGHNYRIMVIAKEHVAHISNWLEEYMVGRLEATGRQVFAGLPKFIIMSPLLGSVPDHAHFVATDLDPNATDFNQILKTPWLKVVDV